MKVPFLFLVLMLFFFQNIFSQVDSLSAEENILTCTKRKQGIYKTFEEFKNNSPSDLRQCQMVKVYVNPESYQLIEFDSLKQKTRKITKGVWGFSDGEDIFICAKNYGNGNWFVKVKELGKFTLVEDLPKSGVPLVLGGGPAGLIGAVVGTAISSSLAEPVSFVVNIKDGKFYALDVPMVKKMILGSKELSEEFEFDKKRRKRLLYYIKSINEFYKGR